MGGEIKVDPASLLRRIMREGDFQLGRTGPHPRPGHPEGKAGDPYLGFDYNTVDLTEAEYAYLLALGADLEDWELEECEGCGEPMPADTPLRQRYCSAACRNRAYNRRKKDAARAQ